MDGVVQIFGEKLEYDFLSAWIKYNRLENGISQDALAYGICSTSYLSYFENGKKMLRPEIIESLLKKLGISEINSINHAGLIRQKFSNMVLQIESLNYSGAKSIYEEINATKDLVSKSPYNIESKIYQLIYDTFISGKNYSELKKDIDILDEIYPSLNEELRYLYLFVSGVVNYKYHDTDEGIRRLSGSYRLKETPWINYFMGFACCFNGDPLKGIYYLEKALKSYEESGRYQNAVWCNNYLGICHSFLKIYDKAEKHFKAALTGAEHFFMDDIFWHLYVNLSNLYFYTGDYQESIRWVEMALKTNGDPVPPACNYIEACFKLNEVGKCNDIFKNYLTDKYKDSKYYYYLYFLYLVIYHNDEDIFYEKTTEVILPYYVEKHNLQLCKEIKIKLIDYLEKKRKYKEANKICKEFIM